MFFCFFFCFTILGYHQIHQQHSKPPEQEEPEKASKGHHFSVPELEHNIKLLEDEAKQDIIRCDRLRQFEEDKFINLGHERGKLEQLLVHEEKQTKTLEKVFEIVQR